MKLKRNVLVELELQFYQESICALYRVINETKKMIMSNKYKEGEL